MIVIDVSALLELLLRTPVASRVEKRLFATSESLHAPQFVDLEVARVLRRYTVDEEISMTRAYEALLDLRSLELIYYSHTPYLEKVWRLSEETRDMTLYDAAYIALAEFLPARLVTCDKVLARAASRYVDVEIVGSDISTS